MREVHSMMGTKERVFSPLCNRSLEDLVPLGNFYRHLEANLDLGFVRDLVRATYKERGRPSVDPGVFFKLQLVMFFEELRSERELIRIAADRLSVRWYLGYDLDENLPDHSSLTKIRQRYGLPVFRRFFEAIVERCREAGLVWGKELYFDATQVKADASLESITPRFAVEAHLGELFADEQADVAGPGDGIDPPVELPVPTAATEREELIRTNEERHDWLARDGRPDRSVTRGSSDARSIPGSGSGSSPACRIVSIMPSGCHARPGTHERHLQSLRGDRPLSAHGCRVAGRDESLAFAAGGDRSMMGAHSPRYSPARPSRTPCTPGSSSWAASTGSWSPSHRMRASMNWS
jgi:transposase